MRFLLFLTFLSGLNAQCCEDIFVQTDESNEKYNRILGAYMKNFDSDKDAIAVYKARVQQMGAIKIVARKSEDSADFLVWTFEDDNKKVYFTKNQSSTKSNCVEEIKIWYFPDKEKTEANIEIVCLKEKLNSACCQRPFWYFEPSSNKSIHSTKYEENILGLYEIQPALVNSVFAYKQTEAKKFKMADKLRARLTPLPVTLQQDYTSIGRPSWQMIVEDLELGMSPEVDVIASSNPISGSRPCPPLNNWHIKHEECETKSDKSHCHKEGEDFHDNPRILGLCLDDDWKITCENCTVDDPNAECIFHEKHHRFQCSCKSGFSKEDVTAEKCVKSKGNARCFECEENSCGASKHEVQCDEGVHTCQVYATGYATGEDFKFTRMCGPKNVFNRVRCLGIRKEESKVEIHRPENGHLINMRYENVTFLCGKSYRCLGNFSARDRVWTIDCDDIKTQIRCESHHTKYQKLSEIENLNYSPADDNDDKVVVNCTGTAVVFALLDSLQYPGQRIIALTSEYGRSKWSEINGLIALPGYSKYLNDKSLMTSGLNFPPFVVCIATNSEEVFGENGLKRDDMKSWSVGLLCTCNTRLCNGLNQQQIIENVHHGASTRSGSDEILLFTEIFVLWLHFNLKSQ